MNIQPSVIIFFGLLISAIGGFWAFLLQNGFDRRPAMIIFGGVVINAVGGLWASHQTSQLNQEFVDSIIGGDSFCYLTVGIIDSANNTGRFVIIHEGKHPLYDVDISIKDLDKLDKIKDKLLFSTLEQTTTNLSIGTLPPSTAQVLHKVTLGNGLSRRFHIQVSARNGHLSQPLRLNKVGGEWVVALQVIRDMDGIIYEKIDEKFPRTAWNTVEW